MPQLDSDTHSSLFANEATLVIDAKSEVITLSIHSQNATLAMMAATLGSAGIGEVNRWGENAGGGGEGSNIVRGMKPELSRFQRKE